MCTEYICLSVDSLFLKLAKPISCSMSKRIIELHNMPIWKGPTRILDSSSQPCTGPSPRVNLVSKDIVKMLLELSGAGAVTNNVPGEPLPVSNHPLGEVYF